MDIHCGYIRQRISVEKYIRATWPHRVIDVLNFHVVHGPAWLCASENFQTPTEEVVRGDR